VFFPPLGASVILLLLLVAAIYCGYRAIAPRPYRWSVGTVLVLWLLLLMAGCVVVASTIH
jgi:amino acid permease